MRRVPAPPRVELQAPSSQLATLVASRLKRLIANKRHSLEKLSEASGIGTQELRKLESGAIAPTIGHLWRIANALGVPFGSLVAAQERQGLLVLRKGGPPSIGSGDGGFSSRPLFPYDSASPVEFYEVTLAAGYTQRSVAHSPRTRENLIIAEGALELSVGHETPVQLGEGDAVHFLADVQHSYRNIGDTPAKFYLVIFYDEQE
jgi:quercetin dioxygenase-like cupin family protein/DNA-binding Xre family transcriptional regulator